jgi:hypothetical protein
MDAVYLFTKSFKNSAFLNQRRVDWALGLVVACFCGVVGSHYFSTWGFWMADFVYIQQFGSRMFEPVFRIFKDGPLGDEMDDLILVFVQYGVFIGSYYVSGIWGFYGR